MNGLFVTGTDTNVGKTWIGAKLIKELIKQQISVKARKPIESGWPSDSDVSDTDAWKLANAMGRTDTLELVCPNRFSAAVSPDRAAMLEGQQVTLKKLEKDSVIGLNDSDFLYVEGAGGFYSPICDDGLNADLALSLELAVLLVVENRLGCINQALLNVEAIHKQGLKLTAIVLNKPNQNEIDESMDNLSDIQKRVDCEVISFDYNQKNAESIKQLVNAILAN